MVSPKEEYIIEEYLTERIESMVYTKDGTMFAYYRRIECKNK